jgi:hypothetical protein
MRYLLTRHSLHSEEGLRRFQAGRLAEKDEEWHRLVPAEAREALGKKEVERQSVLFELFKSERDYVEDLKLVTEVISIALQSDSADILPQVFIEPLQFANPPVIAPDKLRSFIYEVFYNLGPITVHHEHMLAALFERQLDQHPLVQSVTDIVLESELTSKIINSSCSTLFSLLSVPIGLRVLHQTLSTRRRAAPH